MSVEVVEEKGFTFMMRGEVQMLRIVKNDWKIKLDMKYR